MDVEVTRYDSSYEWILYWITAQQQARVNGFQQGDKSGLWTRMFNKLTPGMHHLQAKSSIVRLPNGTIKSAVDFMPGPGRHILRYKNAFISVHRERDTKSFDLKTGMPFENVVLTTLYAQRHIFNEVFHEARLLAEKFTEGKTTIFKPRGMEWTAFGEPKRKRPIESVVLAQGVTDHIVDDVKNFIDARTWYLDRGIPYRRGYLLHGPPGTGKSSFIQALAGKLDFNIAMLHLSERGLTDDKLNHLLNIVPERSIVLLEDADAAFVNRTQADEHGYAGATVTFSGLLNALDGVASAEERIVFLTTNHIERMDEALIRPGRVDMTVKLDHATIYQIEQLWDRFYAEFDGDESGKQRFLEKVKDLGLPGRVSTASLQGLFLYNKDNMEGAIGMVEQLAKAVHASSITSTSQLIP